MPISCARPSYDAGFIAELLIALQLGMNDFLRRNRRPNGGGMFNYFAFYYGNKVGERVFMPMVRVQYQVTSGWARCLLVLALNLSMLGLCVWGAMLSGAFWVAFLVAGISMPFHLALGVLTLSVRKSAAVIRRLLESDTSKLRELWHSGDQRVNAVRDAGQLMVGDRDGSGSLLDAGLTYVQRRLVAGDDFRLDGFREAIRDHIEDLLESLQRFEISAFGVGLAGAVAGLGLQVYIAEETARGGVLAQTFLMGIVVKASTTLAGVIVASYAREMRWRLRRVLSRHAEGIEQFAAVQLSPLFNRVARTGGSAPEAVPYTLDELRVALAAMAKTLGVRLNEAVQEARRLLTEFASNDLASAIRVNVAEPLRKDLTAAGASMLGAATGLQTSSAALQGAVDNFGQRMKAAITECGQIGERIQGASAAASGLSAVFEQVVEHARTAATLVQKCTGELSVAIKDARMRGDGRAVESEFLVAVSNAAEVIRNSSQSLDRALERVVELATMSGRGGAGAM